jgi:hypothetical protein
MLSELNFNHCIMRIMPRQVESRREFFRSAARYGLLGLVSAALSLVARPRRPGGERCVNLGICGSCGIFANCELPQALSAKRAQEKG